MYIMFTIYTHGSLCLVQLYQLVADKCDPFSYIHMLQGYIADIGILPQSFWTNLEEFARATSPWT